MTAVFTLCSANYLAHAVTLGDSLRKHNPGLHFIIGLVDRLPDGLPSGWLDGFEVMPVEEIPMPEFEAMLKKYNIVELNTAMKPFYMDFIYRRDPQVEAVFYLDPDMSVYGSFDSLLEKLRKHSMLVTPHSSTYDDSAANIYYEKEMLSNGVFNLGFIATSRSAETDAFLKWWKTRLKDHCFRKPDVPGSFYDQIWIGLAPIYFQGLFVDNDPGLNFCYWNHFERRLTIRDGRYVVNESHDLIFAHFSGYKPELPGKCIGVNRPDPIESFVDRPDLRPLYDDYRSRLLARNYASIKSTPWHFSPPPVSKTELAAKKFVKNVLILVFDCLPGRLRGRLKRLALFTAKSCERGHSEAA